MTYANANFEVAMSYSLGEDAFTRKYFIWPWAMVKQHVAQNPLHHVTYALAKFAVATSNRLGDNAFTWKYIIWPWVQGHMKCCPVPSTSWDLYTCKVWKCYVEGLRRRCIYKEIHYLTFGSRSKEMLLSTLELHHVTYASVKLEVNTSNG